MDSKIVIELDEQDQKQLREIFQAARMGLESLEEGDVLEACRRLLADAQRAGAPGFVMRRLTRLEILVTMVEDEDWNLPPEDVTRVINALAYFANAKDLIPDDVPGLGFLDDAVMVDLVMRELAQEVKAYESFREFRETELQKRRAAGDKSHPTRADWLAVQREKLSAERESKSWLPWKRNKRSFLD
jgi:uncharacterized membrane protein YkvA (DUF1232 family)